MSQIKTGWAVGIDFLIVVFGVYIGVWIGGIKIE